MPVNHRICQPDNSPHAMEGFSPIPLAVALLMGPPDVRALISIGIRESLMY